MHVPLFDLEEHEADLDPSDTETESPLNYEAITNRKTLNQLYKLYWDSLEVRTLSFLFVKYGFSFFVSWYALLTKS